MEIMDTVSVALRLMHVFGGILWIGFLFFFGFIFSPALMDMTLEVRGAVYPLIMKRVTRWIHATTGLTYLTGLILLGLVFHGGGLMFESGYGWGPFAGLAALLPFLLFIPYELTARSPMGARMAFMGAGLLLVSIGYVMFMTDVVGMTYRASMIHVGVFYGTVMAANVFMRVLPAQKRILAAMAEGKAPDPAELASVQTRAKHNAYLAIPLVWTMLNQHTVIPGASSPVWFALVLVLSLGFVMYLYKPSVSKG